MAILVPQLGRKCLEVLNRPCYTPPVDMLQRGIALPVHAEGCVVLALHQPVPPLVAVLAPHLY